MDFVSAINKQIKIKNKKINRAAIVSLDLHPYLGVCRLCEDQVIKCKQKDMKGKLRTQWLPSSVKTAASPFLQHDVLGIKAVHNYTSFFPLSLVSTPLFAAIKYLG